MQGLIGIIFSSFIEKRQRLTAVEFTQTLLYTVYDFPKLYSRQKDYHVCVAHICN